MSHPEELAAAVRPSENYSAIVIACDEHVSTHALHSMHSSWRTFTLAFSKARTPSTGQAVTQSPQPLHSSGFTWAGMKISLQRILVRVATGE